MIIEVNNIDFAYSKKDKKILNNVSLTLTEGQVMSILGPNGAGKSTLLNCIATLNNVDSGSIKLCGTDVRNMKAKDIASILSYVPQTHTPAFAYTVFNFVLMGRAPKVGMFQKPSDEDFEIVNKVLKEVGIDKLADKPYTEISGGERQQATIARALVQEPKAILFDEPTAHLDYGNQLKTLRVIKSLKEKGYAVTLFGRKRPVPELKSPNFMERQFGERVAMNSPVQGTAADIMKIAMNRVRKDLENMKSGIVLQIHDELLVEVWPDEEEEVRRILKRDMEGAAELAVKLKTDIKTGGNWNECH